jgi:2-methylcitrate dehydratase PrpD
MTYLADRLGAFVSDLKFADIPAEVTRHAKLCLLDALGVALASADMPWCRAVHGLVQAQGGTPEATVSFTAWISTTIWPAFR